MHDNVYVARGEPGHGQQVQYQVDPVEKTGYLNTVDELKNRINQLTAENERLAQQKLLDQDNTRNMLAGQNERDKWELNKLRSQSL